MHSKFLATRSLLHRAKKQIEANTYASAQMEQGKQKNHMKEQAASTHTHTHTHREDKPMCHI